MASTTHSLTYLRPSAVRAASDGAPALALETGGGLTSHGLAPFPRFFSGFLTAPQAAAGGLLAVADVAATRYWQPQNRASLDPVVTGNGDRLRFESFSGCGGVYARLDVLAAGIDGEMLGTGTTNVDVNAPLREALAMVGGGDPLHVAVGPDDVTVTTFDGPVVEKKVPLPERWLRGFAEVQVIASRFDLRAELGAAAAARFLRSLPRNTRQVLWAVPAAGTLRAASAASPGAVCLAGPDRLRALTRVLRHATALRVYGPAVRAGEGPQASAWEVELPGMRLTLTVSPDAARGFSGEGAVLAGLADPHAADDADLVAALLAWEPRVEIGALALESGLTPERVRAALTRLGTAGRIGYDVSEAAYFHRELPYDTGRVEHMNPRLRHARRLVAEHRVSLAGDTARVIGDTATYAVRLSGDGSCTCEWWAGHRGGRGPCKHVLAAQLTARAAADDRSTVEVKA
ncbi:SWIM zinc finger family protein [Yinghuangia seranimata]|uniref:SWIM zinc finger family protein n=1 Tax=Yinghuangia seranimata TaxID=408067 RepID=UPI00248C1990|nr:SWIM zinc finger family protein [Yinghuangia seranimata]MDI2125916.1 SWIM zinc finger family protein [Yinghuangia seranimata]